MATMDRPTCHTQSLRRSSRLQLASKQRKSHNQKQHRRRQRRPCKHQRKPQRTYNQREYSPPPTAPPSTTIASPPGEPTPNAIFDHIDSTAKQFHSTGGRGDVDYKGALGILLTMNLKPPPASTGTIDHQKFGKTLHGGTTGTGAIIFMLYHQNLFNITKPRQNFNILELGSNDGAFGVYSAAAAAGASKALTDVFLFECVPERAQTSRSWRSCIRNFQSKLSTGKSIINFSFPHIIDIPFQTKAAKNILEQQLTGPSLIYFNNFNACIPEETIKGLISTCTPKSVLIAMSRILDKDLSWEEEIFHSFVPRKELPYRSQAHSNPNQRKGLVFYKYTKISSEPIHGKRPRTSSLVEHHRLSATSSWAEDIDHATPPWAKAIDYYKFARRNDRHGLFGLL